MPKLNGGRVKARTNSAPPDHYPPYNEQELDDFREYFGQPVMEAELPTSPMTKQLREDQQLHKKSQQQAAVPALLETKLLERPSSGGNDIEARGFALLPPPKKIAQPAQVAEPTVLCFAPINKKVGNVRNGSVEQIRPGSRTPTASPQPGTPLHVQVNQKTCSVPESCEVVSTKAEIHDAIIITSDPAQSVDEDNVQGGEGPEQSETGRVDIALEPMEGITLNETTVEEALPAGFQHDGTRDDVRSSPQHSPAPAPQIFPREDEGAEETFPPATPSAAPGSLHAPRTPKKCQPTPVLITPAGVKANRQARNKSSGTKHVQMTPESTPPSEEDLLYVLMHRCRERGEATQRSLTKIKILEHRNFELHTKAQEIGQERDNAIAAQTEANERYSSLQTSLEDFKSKYSKLKNFARSTHQDLLLLRQGADVQKTSFQDLKQFGDHVQSSLRDAGACVRVVETSLDKQKQSLATIRSEADRIVSESTRASAKLSASSGRITDLTLQKNRLEGHIVSLENAQERATYAAMESNRDVSAALAKVDARLNGIECAAVQAPPPSEAAKQCLVLLLALHQGKEPTAKDFQDLAKSVTTLKDTVVKGVKDVGGKYQNLQMVQRAGESGEVVEQLKQYVKGLQLSATQMQDANEERVAQQARLQSAQDMVVELQKSVARAESYNAIFQKVLENLTGNATSQQERHTQLQSQIDQYQIRYNSKSSELATVRREVADKCQAMDEKVSKLQGLLEAEESKRVSFEEELKQARRENARALNDENQTLRDQLSEKTIALGQARAAEIAAKEESDNATAKLMQEFQTLQQSHKPLESTSLKVQSDAEKLQQEHESLQGQLETAVEQGKAAEKLKEQLKTVEARCEQADKEVEALRGTESQLGKLRQQFELQQKEADTKTTEMNRLREQLAATEQYSATVEKLNNRLKTAEHDAKSLQEKLTQVTAEATQVGDLQARLLSTSASVEKLETEVSAARETQQKLDAVSKENDDLAHDVTGIRNDLARAQQQIQKQAGLEERLRLRDEEIAQLRQRADLAQELSESLATQKEESQQRESEIASLRSELERIKAESQEAAEAQATNAESQLVELEGFVTQQSNISFLQRSQTQQPNGSQSRGVDDRLGIQDGERPQRKVADRSAQRKPARPLRQLSQSDLKGSRPESTSSTNIVPNSQMNAHVRDVLGLDEADHNNHRVSSPQSVTHSDDEEPTDRGLEESESSQPEIPETLQDNLRPLQEAQGLHTQTDASVDRDVNAARPSSSATSVDLFKQHENNLGAATQPWKVSQPDVETPDQPRSIRGHGHPKLTSPSTIASDQLHFDSINAVAAGVVSPKTTRSGMPFRERYVTPTRDFGPNDVQGMMEITPTVRKERHQPNSAVKRSAEGDGPPAKRLERHPERLAVRDSSKPTNHLASGSSQSNVTPASRKGGSVVGTPAPAPGRSQKSSKAPRKSSKKDKYIAKFSESS